MKLYHFTRPTNLPSIRERGLMPALLRALPRWQRHAGVWLTLRPVLPCDYDCTAMLTVRLAEFDPYLHAIDYPEDPHPDDWRIYLGTIPPDKIDFTTGDGPGPSPSATLAVLPPGDWE